jgi:hypothetical protein
VIVSDTIRRREITARPTLSAIDIESKHKAGSNKPRIATSLIDATESALTRLTPITPSASSLMVTIFATARARVIAALTTTSDRIIDHVSVLIREMDPRTATSLSLKLSLHVL